MKNVIFGRQFCIWELLAWETLYFDFVIKPKLPQFLCGGEVVVTYTLFMYLIDY
jgi:hypothetical protein